MALATHYDRYKELEEQYKIKHGTYGLTPDTINNYDVVIECIGTGYAHKKYRVISNKPQLSIEDLAIICDCGNLCFGYRTEGSIICVHTD